MSAVFMQTLKRLVDDRSSVPTSDIEDLRRGLVLARSEHVARFGSDAFADDRRYFIDVVSGLLDERAQESSDGPVSRAELERWRERALAIMLVTGKRPMPRGFAFYREQGMRILDEALAGRLASPALLDRYIEVSERARLQRIETVGPDEFDNDRKEWGDFLRRLRAEGLARSSSVIRQRRAQAGLTQRELGIALGEAMAGPPVSEVTVRRWELRLTYPTYKHRVALAAVLGGEPAHYDRKEHDEPVS